MNKTGKKNIVFSKDLNDFSDLIRKSISSMDEYGDINLNNDLIIKELKDEFISIDSAGNDVKKYNGTISIKSNISTIDLLLSSSIEKNIENIYFDYDKHYEQNKEIPINNIENIDNKLKIKIDFNYNFYNKKYEEFLDANLSSLEQNLPDYYSMVEEYFSNKNNIDLKNFDPSEIYNYPEQNIKLNTDKNHLSLNILDSYILNKDGYLSVDKYMNSININKSKIPFYTNIYFDAHEKQSNNFNNFFHEHGVFKSLLTYINKNLKNEKIIIKDDKKNTQELSVKSLTFDDQFTVGMLNITEPATLFSLYTLINDKHSGLYNTIVGTKNYSEVIGYRISKYTAFGDSADPVEEWLIPNISEYGYEIIDSQIKYNKNYKYKISSFVLVIGSDYKYTNIKRASETEATVEYTEMPKVKIFEIDSCTYINKLMDKPPLEPEIEFYPYVQTNDKIKIYLKNKTGLYRYPPMPFNKAESSDYMDLINTQHSFDNKLFFGNDEIANMYLIYRLDKKPEKYSDFYNQLLSTVEVNNKTISLFEDTINFSKTYYYLFRSVDNHGHGSNPSDVFEVNLSEGKITFRAIEIEKNNKTPFKPFKRYLKISPSVGQKILSSISDLSVDLGVNAESVWNKNFKIRLVSKNSSKKIDINLLFNYQIDK